jgi:hypothetical protein
LVAVRLAVIVAQHHLNLGKQLTMRIDNSIPAARLKAILTEARQNEGNCHHDREHGCGHKSENE